MEIIYIFETYSESNVSSLHHERATITQLDLTNTYLGNNLHLRHNMHLFLIVTIHQIQKMSDPEKNNNKQKLGLKKEKRT